tara:strand:+ start:212 stop:2620 length:2409 start_codon:yes stop_codon:yes gene_type:complete
MDNIRVKKESLHDWRSEFQDQVDEGALKLAAGAAVLALPYLAKKFLKPKVDKKIEDARNNLKIGGNRRSGTTNEEVQGGISVQNYSDGVQFNEIETVDIIKAPSLKEVYRTKNPPIKFEDDNRPIKDRPGVQIGPARINPDEPIKKPEPQVPRFPAGQKPSGGKRIPLQSDRVYRPETDNEGNIIPPKLNTRPFTKKPVKLVPKTTTQLDHYDWRSELIIDEGNRTRFKGYSLSGSGNKKDMSKGPNEKVYVDYTKIQAKADKKKELFAASHEVEGDLVDEGLVRGALQGAGLLWKLGKWGIPKAVRALKNKGAADITKFKKSQEVVRRVNNIEKIRTTNALKGTDVKGVFTKSKVKPELNKINWKSTVPKTTPTASTTSTKRLTSSRPHLDHPTSKGLTYQQKQSKATNIIAKIRGNTPTQQKSKEILSRMNNAINKSNKPGTYSSKVNAAKNIPDPVTSIVPSPSGSLRKITKSSSALVSNRPPKIRPQNKLTGVNLKGLLKSTEKAIPVKPKTNIQRPSGKPAPKPEWGGPRRAPKPEWGTGTPPRSKRAHQAPEPAWGEPKLKDRLTKSSVLPVNKSVSATVKGGSATGLVAGIVKGSSLTKDSKIAKSDTVETPEIKKDKDKKIKDKLTPIQKLEQRRKDKIDRYGTTGSHLTPLEQELANEAAMAIPIGIGLGKTAVKLGGSVLAAKGGEEILKRLLRGKDRQDYDWEKNPKDDIDRELNTRQKQARDSEKNKEFDTDMKSYRKGKKNISDEDKIQRLKDAAKKHRKSRAKSPEINRNQGTMTDKQIERMKKAGLL